MLRTMPLLYAVGAPLILVLVVSGPFVKAGIHGHMPLWAFPMCVFFAQLGFRQLLGNWHSVPKARGFNFTFLPPLHCARCCSQRTFVTPWCLRYTLVGGGPYYRLCGWGRLMDVIVAITIAWLGFSLPINLAVGNILSITMPYRINPGRISRQRGSQISTIVSLLLEAGVLGVGAAVFAICSVVGMLWLAIPSFLVLTIVAVLVWLRILANSDGLAAQHKDMMLTTLVKAE